jgi:hypothetical protein
MKLVADAAHPSRSFLGQGVWGEIWHFDGAAALVRDEFLRRRAPDDYRDFDRFLMLADKAA